MYKLCANCQQGKDLQVWFGYINGYICADCAASIYHQKHCYNKKVIDTLKDKLHRRNKQIKDLKVKLSMAITQMEGCSAWLKSSNQPQVAKGTDEIIKKLECPFCYGEGEAKEFKEV